MCPTNVTAAPKPKHKSLINAVPSARQCGIAKRCQKEQWSAHKTICQAIKELSQRENLVILETAFISHLTPTQHAKVVSLVGRKCTVKC